MVAKVMPKLAAFATLEWVVPNLERLLHVKRRPAIIMFTIEPAFVVKGLAQLLGADPVMPADLCRPPAAGTGRTISTNDDIAPLSHFSLSFSCGFSTISSAPTSATTTTLLTIQKSI
jgi:hypothetical protein